MAATIIANLLGDRSIWSALIFAICNAGEAVIVAGIIERYFGPVFNLDRLSHVLGFLGAVVAGTAISGVGGTLGYVLFHTSTTPPLTIRYHWFTSDALGVITVAPLLIGLMSSARDPSPRGEIIEQAQPLAGDADRALRRDHFCAQEEPWATAVPIAALFPLLLRARGPLPAGVRRGGRLYCRACSSWFGRRHSASAFSATLQVSDGGTRSCRPSGRHLRGIAVGHLFSAALFAERRQHEAVLMASEARRCKKRSPPAASRRSTGRCTATNRSAAKNAAQILGFGANEDFGGAAIPGPRSPWMSARACLICCAAFGPIIRCSTPPSASSVPTAAKYGSSRPPKASSTLPGASPICAVLHLDITGPKGCRGAPGPADRRARPPAVKNVLARVAVVAMQTREGSLTMDEYIKAVERAHPVHGGRPFAVEPEPAGRVSASTIWSATSWRLTPWRRTAKISGPNIMLSAAATQAVAMVLHELVTNAAKYGALSTSNGSVSVKLDTTVQRARSDARWDDRLGAEQRRPAGCVRRRREPALAQA